MELFDPDNVLRQYVEEHCSPQDEVLDELYRYTFLNAVNPRMIAGPVHGKFLEMISRMLKPGRILEIGTFTGYSAICLARGLKPGGNLTTIEVNDELREVSLEYFQKAGLSGKIKLINGNALEILPSLKEKYDLIYIDAEKDQYPEYYLLCKKLLNPGGYILADNVLWDGKVIVTKGPVDKSTKGILAFNKMVQEDHEVDNLMMPFMDGVMVIRDKGDKGITISQDRVLRD